jgi:hypothetical protein
MPTGKALKEAQAAEARRRFVDALQRCRRVVRELGAESADLGDTRAEVKRAWAEAAPQMDPRTRSIFERMVRDLLGSDLSLDDPW